jgi:hypothetical protein
MIRGEQIRKKFRIGFDLIGGLRNRTRKWIGSVDSPEKKDRRQLQIKYKKFNS